jgi:hypothetical protein
MADQAYHVSVESCRLHLSNGSVLMALMPSLGGQASTCVPKFRKLTAYPQSYTSIAASSEKNMSYAYELHEDVHHQPQGPQGRAGADAPVIYTVVRRMPVEADGRIRYRIKSKSGNTERVVTEDQLSYPQ